MRTTFWAIIGDVFTVHVQNKLCKFAQGQENLEFEVRAVCQFGG